MTDYLKEAERSLKYLAESEDEYARLKGLLKVQPDRIKAIIAKEILSSPESSQAAKKAWAEAGEAYSQALDEYQGIVDLFEVVNCKRRRAEMTIEMFRSVNSSMKRGNI
jgi:hypothetical protein